MIEKDLYGPFSKWISKNWNDRGSAVFELKHTKTERFRMAEVKPHQERALLMALDTGVYHKISDQSQVAKPFDSFIIKNAAAYLVICFGRYACFIHIQTWMTYKKEHPETKSLSKTDCRILSIIEAML